MFDPFLDFDTQGYLHNIFKEKDLNIIKRLEHQHFKRNSKSAISFLAKKKQINYADILKVHEILFADLYPWAGQDRLQTTPDLAISKGSVIFCHPYEIKKYINEALRLSNKRQFISEKPGEIIGLLAYAHPFLDGNGRTIILVHSELCNRANFSIDWTQTKKEDYLNALTKELDKPAIGILDNYLLQYKTNALDLDSLQEQIDTIKGLDGMDYQNKIEGNIDSLEIQKRYQKHQQQRGYKISTDKDAL